MHLKKFFVNDDKGLKTGMDDDKGLKTGMDFRGQIWKRMGKMTFFGLKYGQDLENRAAHPHQIFLGVPGETVPCKNK